MTTTTSPFGQKMNAFFLLSFSSVGHSIEWKTEVKMNHFDDGEKNL